MKKTAIALFFLFAAPLFIAAPLAASYEEALKLYQEGKHKESLVLLARELDVSKDLDDGAPNYRIRFLAAHNHWKLGNNDSAIIHFRRCMDMKNNPIDPYVDLSLFFLEKNRLNEAETCARNGLQKERNAMLYYVLGEAARRRGNFERAKEFLETANSIDPENFVSYNALGMTLIHLGRYGDANTAFSVALAINAASAEVMNNIGVSLERLAASQEASGNQKGAAENYKNAFGYYRKANELDMENKTILENLNRLKNKIN
ncbi:MAG: tetratricopeptide repeat protein [Leptospirales bacterium]|nr:tetratricopeptide repeat protein [Leptospirales bacterium]